MYLREEGSFAGTCWKHSFLCLNTSCKFVYCVISSHAYYVLLFVKSIYCLSVRYIDVTCFRSLKTRWLIFEPLSKCALLSVAQLAIENRQFGAIFDVFISRKNPVLIGINHLIEYFSLIVVNCLRDYRAGTDHRSKTWMINLIQRFVWGV